MCDEKNIWLMANKDTASVELIFKKKDELYEALHYIFLKLEDLGKKLLLGLLVINIIKSAALKIDIFLFFFKIWKRRHDICVVIYKTGMQH